MSAVSLYYYLVLLKHIYVVDAKDQSRIITPTYLNVALGLVALAVVLLGVYPKPILEASQRPRCCSSNRHPDAMRRVHHNLPRFDFHAH